MYIVGFNGPPESGKDSLAEGLAGVIENLHNIPVKFESLSMPLRKIAYAAVDFKGDLDGPDYARFKTTEFSELGVTGRQLMIDVSEKFLKPTYGISVMAKLLIERNAEFHGLLLIRDCGFQCEVDPLIQWAGSENFFIARCHRPTKNFANDSREYVYHHATRLMDDDYYNESTEWNWKTVEAQRVYARIVNLGWKL
jgi:hypothetical protein